MVKWKFWQRNKQSQADPDLPEEVQEYYDSTRRERVGVAWLLAFATVVVTLLVALLLYFGGRWVVDRFFSDDQSTVEIAQQDDPGIPGEPSANGSDGDTDIEDEDSSSTNDNDSAQTDTSTPDQRPQSGTTPQSPTTLPSDGTDSSRVPETGSAESLPDTGPGGVIAVFTAVSAFAGTVHYFIRRK